MKHPITGVLFFLLLCAAALPIPVSGELIVRPGSDLVPPATAVSVIPESIPVLELPAGILASVLAGSVAEFIFAIKIWAALGYRRVEKQTVLAHAARLRIFSCIRDNPGIHLSGLAKRTGICMGTLRHHIGILLRTGIIASGLDRNKIRFFENSGKYPACEQVLLGYLRNETSCAILDAIRADPHAGRNMIARRVGITGAAVTWHMHRFEAVGIIRKEMAGKSARYLIADELLAGLSGTIGPAKGNHEPEPEPEPGTPGRAEPARSQYMTGI
ncbi:MAG: winged helix-turn-helix transcriptional regulator [Methanoregula sp.]|jgi:predicted transcriptional regulator